MNGKHWQSIYNADVNVNLMEQNEIQINGKIKINVDLHVIVKMENI